MSVQKDEFTTIKQCLTENQSNCFLSWQSYKDGITPSDHFDAYRINAFVINPITWTTEAGFSSLKDHKGLLMSNYKTVYKNALRVRINKETNILWIEKPNIPFSILRGMKNFHIADYNLYWFDIRKNVSDRTQNFLNNKKGAN